ncbi:MAG TPA: SDR family oxidoreductase [Blastocatellia bacterium]|nr:SDR family oxidoreductase [Blastocatellia bacterium]HMV82653.1 SDR family oxidoreductase [Blastocatellia bacterium]HMX30228.1 SDR family oxidoreductase [Blastocatellia bacterium]HMZ20482.1 SDR family oxidoreductase [Blastocatellia bacterium]HNG32300.1 SDR family oxidoreductase [Blastocatellia bacterium]
MKIDRNTVAVVTGAASGIGRALAVRLAAEGAQLAISDVNQAGLEETAQLAAKSGVKLTSHLVDVSDRERMAAFVDEVLTEHGRANLVVNNAGVALGGTAEQLSIEDIEWLMSINFWGVVYGTKMFLPVLRQQSRGHIVNISSVFGLIGPPGHAAYAASKFAVRGFTEVLRHELAGSNITVSCVHPGGIRTNIARNARAGAGADESIVGKEGEFFDKVAKTLPETAAERIVRGVLRDEEKILIGQDAWAIDKVQRLMPVKYWSFLGKMLEKLAK